MIKISEKVWFVDISRQSWKAVATLTKIYPCLGYLYSSQSKSRKRAWSRILERTLTWYHGKEIHFTKHTDELSCTFFLNFFPNETCSEKHSSLKFCHKLHQQNSHTHINTHLWLVSRTNKWVRGMCKALPKQKLTPHSSVLPEKQNGRPN